MGRSDARGYREVKRLGRIGRVVKEFDGVGVVRRVGWLRSSEGGGEVGVVRVVKEPRGDGVVRSSEWLGARRDLGKAKRMEWLGGWDD